MSAKKPPPKLFVSYAQADRAIATELVGDLVFMGYDVWWDFHLRAGEAFRDTIMTQLRQADAVVGIWTKQSGQSKWVRQECDEALRVGKLVPTRSPDLAIHEIPIGFREEHTVSVRDTDAIRSALNRLGLRPCTGITSQMMETIGGELDVTVAIWDAYCEFQQGGILEKIKDEATQDQMYAKHSDVVAAIDRLVRDKKSRQDHTLRFPIGDARIMSAMRQYFIDTNEAIPIRLCFLDWEAEETVKGVRFIRNPES